MSRMRPERWQQVERIFGEALERAPEHRPTFLNDACAGDEELRREVESLIASHEQPGSLFEAPPFALTAEMTEKPRMALPPGKLVTHYKIIREIGRGGMGEVYLAHDTKLGRPVALKVLPSEFIGSQDRLRRFEQEARAASALSHPNIVTIHEIGQADSIYYIATEYIEGVTLRQQMAGTRLRLGEALDVSIQVASALSAAHQAGVVHRDIKPENIMLRPDGYIKVLDFGLAKLTERPAVNPEASTRALIKTDAGVVMGTAHYMSPEQARGLQVDARTDVWSLGVVLYEMVTGRAPFEGETISDVIAKILEREPTALLQLIPEVPTELQRIVKKALRKDREERYQSAKDMALDLKSLRRELEVEAELEHSVEPQPGSAATASGGELAAQPARQAAAVTKEIAGARPTTSAEYIVGEIKSHKRGALLILATVIIAAVGIAFGLRKFVGQNKSAAAPFQAMKVTRLTTTGKATDAAISPDGKYVVHVVTDAGRQSIWLRHVATASDTQIVPPTEGQYYGLTFSPDGNFVYYVKGELFNWNGAIYQVPVLGGTSRKLVEGAFVPIKPLSVSPDGKRLVFLLFNLVQGEISLIVANADGSGEQRLATRKIPEALLSPAWSPDGKMIAFTVISTARRGLKIVGVPVDGEPETLISSSQELRGQEGLAWLSDGSGLVVIANDQWSSPFQIWEVSYPGGQIRRVTNDLNNYSSISLTSDSHVLAAVQKEQIAHIWVAPDGDAGRAKQITSSKDDGFQGISWTPDGKVVYTSSASGSVNIWIADANGRNRHQLTNTNDVYNIRPAVSPDGRYVAFTSRRAGERNIWRMDIDGGNLKQLTKGNNELHPTWSPDGKWVIYHGWVSGASVLLRVSVDGGEPVQLTSTEGWFFDPAVSPDGKLIACTYQDKPNSAWKFAVIPFEGGQPVKIFDIPPTAFITHARWTLDGRALAYIDTKGGVSNIWTQPLDGSSPRRLTDFKSDQIFWFDWSRDGKSLALARGAETSDVVLISNFR